MQTGTSASWFASNEKGLPSESFNLQRVLFPCSVPQPEIDDTITPLAISQGTRPDMPLLLYVDPHTEQNVLCCQHGYGSQIVARRFLGQYNKLEKIETGKPFEG
jgi:hypothetical protein